MQFEDLTIVETNYIMAFENNSDFRQILKVDLAETGATSITEAIAILEDDPRVESVSPNYYHQSHLIPDDPVYNNVATNMQAIYRLIGAENAWNITTGSHNVKVGVLDTGVFAHEDLEENLTVGYDFYHNDTTTTDDTARGHGTHIAGIIGAVGNNTVGSIGVSPSVTIVPLQASWFDTFFDTSAIVKAIYYAIFNDIDILNCSFGSKEHIESIYNALKMYDGLIVCSAGNAGNESPRYPAAYDLDNIISVAASTSTDQLTTFSNRHATLVDLVAPGEYIYSTVSDAYKRPDNSTEPIHPSSVPTTYASMSGTSMAAPFVSGTAALLLSHNPHLTAKQLKSIILNSVDVIPELEGQVATSGRLNVYKALQNTLEGNYEHTISTRFSIPQGNTVSYAEFILTYNTELYSPDFITIAPSIIERTTYDHDVENGIIRFVYYPTNATILPDTLVRLDFNTRHKFSLNSTDFEWELIKTFDENNYIITLDGISQTVLLGDVDLDGEIDTADVRELQSFVSTGGGDLTELQQFAGDVNCDGTLNTPDSMKIMQYINGVIMSFL